jgi:hypothetical protein
MNDGKNRLENLKIKTLMKEHLTITLFGLAMSLIAVFLSDIIIFPITYFAVRNVDIFNVIFKYSLLLLIVFSLSAAVFLKGRAMYRDEKSSSAIIYSILIRLIPAFIIIFMLIKISGIIYISFRLFFFLILIMLITAIFFKIRSLFKDGNSFLQIVMHLFVRFFQTAGFFLAFILILSVVILIIYLLFSMNYYYLHRMAGGA